MVNNYTYNERNQLVKSPVRENRMRGSVRVLPVIQLSER